MAHKKGVGSTDNGRDSNSKRLGIKLYGGQHAVPGNIIVRQRGTKYHPGENVGMGRDHTLHALIDGTISYQKRRKNRTWVHVFPNGVVTPTHKKAKAAPAVKSVAPGKAVAATPKAEAQVAKTPKATSIADKLTKIEGIGPKVNGLLNTAGILTFIDLANASYETLKGILANAGSRYQMMDPTTWPQQSQLAADGNWDELKVLQDKLDGGRVVDEQE